MFIGHFAAAMATKPAAPRTSLGWLFAASQFPDLLWPVFLLTGIESARIAPGDTAFTPLAFDHYPWSHSLLMVVIWGVLLGGLDQGVVIPSLSWVVGLRTPEGAEFGIGPNVTPAGVALVLSAGITVRTGALNVPMNFAVVPTKVGTRVSVLTGFTFRH